MTSFLRQKTTAITEADGVHFFWFAGKSNGDVIGLKVTDTSSGMIEVHVLDADDDYQSFKLQKPTPLSLAERPNFYFIGGDGDVIGIKTANTSSGMVEVHSLDGSEGYQKFSLQKTTAIKASDAPNFRWVKGGPHGDIIGIKLHNTPSGNVEIHVLDGSEDFQSFSLQQATNVPGGDYKYKWTGADGDVIAVQWTATVSGKAEAYVLGKSDYSHFSTGLNPVTPIVAPTDAKNFRWAAADINDDSWQDLIGIKYQNTESHLVEIHILDGKGFLGNVPAPPRDPPEKHYLPGEKRDPWERAPV